MSAWATLADGVRIHHRVQGPPGAPWVVLVNGLLSDTTMWAGVLPGLTRDHRVLTFDGRGQGRSDCPPGPYGTARMAQDLRELLDHLGIERPWLVGLSNGSAISLELLSASPGAWRGAVLTSSVAHMDFAMRLRLRHWLRCLDLGGPGLQFDAVAPFLWSDAFLEPRYEVLKAYHEARKDRPELSVGSRHQIEGAMHWDIRDRLGAIADPVLFLAGAEDLLTPPWKCQETAALVPGSRFEVVAGVGHAFPVENPKYFVEKTREFLEL